MADFQASDYRIFKTSNLCALIFFIRVLRNSYPDQETEVFDLWDFRYPEILRAGDQRVTGNTDTGRDLPGTLGEGTG